MLQLPSGDPNDPGFRRLRYVRYADDFVLGFIGPKAEAGQIKESLETFLRDTLKLQLSREKTLITHATSQAAGFLGYELVNQQANDQLAPNTYKGRVVNGKIGLRVPAKVIEQHCRAYMRSGKPAHRNDRLSDDDFTVVSRYQAEFRGVIQYYLLGPERLPLRAAAMGHGVVAGQDPGKKAPNHSPESVSELQEHRTNRAWGTRLPQGRGTAA